MAHQVYLPASSGPFRCDHCTYYTKDHCRHPQIIKLLGKDKTGLAKVDPGGCSDYFERDPKKARLSNAVHGLKG